METIDMAFKLFVGRQL